MAAACSRTFICAALIGEEGEPETRRGRGTLFVGRDGILRLNELRSMHLGPEEVLLTVSVDVVSEMSADQVEAAISEMERQIKQRYPSVKRVFIEAQSWRAHQADRRGAAQRAASSDDAALSETPQPSHPVEGA